MCELSIIIVLIIISYVSGIGCPVKFFTGISCPGCGMTRAWEAAFSLDFHQAFLYHPLFWTIPFIIIFFFLRKNISKKLNNIALYLFIALFMGVYIVRMFLCQNDIVSADISDGFVLRLFKTVFKMP